MTTVTTSPSTSQQYIRILSGAGADLTRHHTVYGRLRHDDPTVIRSIVDSGLLGRGGAGFPAGTKLANTRGRRPVVVANGAEGEPLSSKDEVLLTNSPHLVLDGLATAAAQLGSNEAYLYVPSHLATWLRRIVDDRRATQWDPIEVTVVESSGHFVSGEKTAVLSAVEGKLALPRDQRASVSISGVRGRPTLIHNVETLAHIATIARYGASWFRSTGAPDEPGTMLVTLSGAVSRPGVAEVPVGISLDRLLIDYAGARLERTRAVLMGGFHGTWLRGAELPNLGLSHSALAPLGASPGAGVVHVLGTSECGLESTARAVRFLADESAGQCGPCLNGLPRLAVAITDVARGRAGAGAVELVHRYANLVDGRGACHHPDGTARLVRSALTAFAGDIRLHGSGTCEASEADTTTKVDFR
ncbi:NADH-ubiquinone oxidoreductase-F iron-sulfur binding region domain-containing protein [Rhodococcoides fascians]|uniref:NADH-ubiquinone oxidoreductase-F iron-sulfur binding region domain-containing protein n=1 Tax=Rhodococcoides fascians TaxID=1828 RepID=UPI0005662DA1|nr:NADH-ubiquinone oxidoreductase-F iron-sulfur binding region domain-containing protein [Rhodococcus fascians]